MATGYGQTVDQSETQQWVLPSFITTKTRSVWFFLIVVYSTVIYMLSNHNQIFEPTLIPMSRFDMATPFIPWTVWLYTSELGLFVTTFLILKDQTKFNQAAYSFITLQTISVAIFVIFPTTFPREQFPLIASEMHPWTLALFEHLRTVDTPVNCAPSLHVSSCFICAMIFYEKEKLKYWILISWSTIVAVSTMTTKQHYLIDVVLGIALAYAVYWFFQHKVTYKPYQAN